MSTKHTPGPWEAIAKTNPDKSEGTHWIRCAHGALGYWRGHKRAHADSNWVLNEADARLIAAAPELLEALDLVASLASQEWQEADGTRKGAVNNLGERLWFISPSVMEAARAAISKALGEQK